MLFVGRLVVEVVQKGLGLPLEIGRLGIHQGGLCLDGKPEQRARVGGRGPPEQRKGAHHRGHIVGEAHAGGGRLGKGGRQVRDVGFSQAKRRSRKGEIERGVGDLGRLVAGVVRLACGRVETADHLRIELVVPVEALLEVGEEVDRLP